MRKPKHTKIIILSVLLILVIGFLTASAFIANKNKNDTPEIVTADVGNLVGNDDSFNIQPMGWWDDLWKIPQEIQSYGTLHVGDYNTTVSSGSYTNKSFGYTAPDGLTYVQDRHETGSWGSYWIAHRVMLSNSNTNGWYYFRGYSPDPKGDYSYESRICLDTVKPQIQVRINGSSVASGTTTTSSSASISVLGSDTLSGVASYWYKTGSGSYYQCYASSTFSSNAVYTFYCVDYAGNVSDTVTVTKDSTAPTVGAYNGSSAISNGAILYASSVNFTASDSTTGVDGIYIMSPSASYYSYYAGTTVTLSAEGQYYYYARDKAGNQSSTYSFTIDRTVPTVQLYSGTSAVSNNYYSAASYIRFTSSDTNGATCYMRKDGGSYSAYASGTNLTAEGVYNFYAVDPASNTSATYTITLDRTAPVGTLYAGTTAVSSGKITNAAYVTFTAADTYALSTLYVMKPNTTSYVSFTSGTQFTADGWYYFYATDKSGNASSAVSILLDRTKPTVTIYGGTSIVPNGSYTNKGYVSFTATDAGSGVAAMYVKIPDSGSYITFVTGTPLYREGTYYFYASDISGNVSDTVSVKLDTTSPTGAITSGGAAVTNNSYTNKPFSYTATDSGSGILRCEIKRPNGAWETYTTGTEIPATADGWYSFRAVDNSGNVSEESRIGVITTAPSVNLYADESPVNDGTYTRAARISMSAVGENVKACYVKLPNAAGFIHYNQFFTYTAAGRYEFYAEDYAGGSSGVYSIIIDRTAKPVAVNGLVGGIASENASVVWEDGDLATTAPIVTVTVNGVPYQNGSALKTIDGGVYRIESTDAAGNIWTTSFTAMRTEVLSATLNKQYFESVDGSGSRYAFESNAKALAFAKARESMLVRSDVWNSATWDGGIPMDSADSKNAKNGTFYIYKKSGDKTAEVAYFTLDRLNAVIAEYAAESVKAYFWWEKSPAQIYNGNNLYGLTANRIFVGNSVSLSSHANYLIDSEPYSELVYDTEGEHLLTVYDDFGNSYEYALVIVKSAPDVFYKLSGGVFNKATDDRQYIFKEALTVKIEDEFGSNFAMYIIRNSAGEIISVMCCGDEYTFKTSGRYSVQAINHGGLSSEIHFMLSLNSPVITTNENAEHKRLEVKIAPSADSGAQLTNIQIYKSVDGGLTWTLLSKDDYGRSIDKDKLFYEFNKDGLYRVAIEDNFRSGIDAVSAEHEYVKPAPEGTLSGVNDGGYTSDIVKFTWTDEAKATVAFDGMTAAIGRETTAYASGTELTADGNYTLTFCDDNGFETSYTFTIKTAAPVAELSRKPVNGYVKEPVALTFEKDSTALLYKDGKLIGGYESGTELPDDGEYKLVVTDLAGNQTTVIFTLDTTAPTLELVGVEDGGTLKGGTVLLRNLSETATVEVYFNGGIIPYTLGETLSELGSYRIVLSDAAGNLTEYNFEIAYAVNAAGAIIIGAVVLAVIGGGIAVFFIRKRGKFSKKR